MGLPKQVAPSQILCPPLFILLFSSLLPCLSLVYPRSIFIDLISPSFTIFFLLSSTLSHLVSPRTSSSVFVIPPSPSKKYEHLTLQCWHHITGQSFWNQCLLVVLVWNSHPFSGPSCHFLILPQALSILWTSSPTCLLTFTGLPLSSYVFLCWFWCCSWYSSFSFSTVIKQELGSNNWNCCLLYSSRTSHGVSPRTLV